MINRTLEEVKHPETRAKLEGIQEIVLAMDEEMAKLRKTATEKHGIYMAANAIATRIHQETAAVQSKLDEEKFGPEEAKIRIEQIQRCVTIIREIEENNRREHIVLQGKLLGMEDAVKINQTKFDEALLKYQRWQRIEAEEKAEAAVPGGPKGFKKGKKKGK